MASSTHGSNVTSQELLISTTWNKARDWNHLVQLNKTFLSQLLGLDGTAIPPYTADFGENLIPDLLSLHEYRFFGISGQERQAPGSIELLPDSETWKEHKREQYLEFFIPDGETSKKFIGVLLKDSQLQGVAFDWDGKKFIGSSENNIRVAWYRESSSQESLNDAQWEIEAVIPATHDRNNYADLSTIKAFYETNPIFCAITTVEKQVDLLERIANTRHLAETRETDDSGYWERRQIPFVTFFVFCKDEDAATKEFLNALLNDSQLVVSAIDFRQDPPVFWPESYMGNPTVTYDRLGRSRDGLLKAEWKGSYGIEGLILFEFSDLGEVSAAIGLPLGLCKDPCRHSRIPRPNFL